VDVIFDVMGLRVKKVHWDKSKLSNDRVVVRAERYNLELIQNEIIFVHGEPVYVVYVHGNKAEGRYIVKR
jgi:hypothetical protein